MKSLQAAAAAAIRRASEEGGGARSGSMDGSQRAIIRDLSQKVSDLCRELADARRQQHIAQASCFGTQCLLYLFCLIQSLLGRHGNGNICCEAGPPMLMVCS